MRIYSQQSISNCPYMIKCYNYIVMATWVVALRTQGYKGVDLSTFQTD